MRISDRFQKHQRVFYTVMIGIALAVYIATRWVTHRQPSTESDVEWTHVDIDGECIKSETTTITTMVSGDFPFVETTTRQEIIHWVGRDTHWFRDDAGLPDVDPSN